MYSIPEAHLFSPEIVKTFIIFQSIEISPLLHELQEGCWRTCLLIKCGALETTWWKLRMISHLPLPSLNSERCRGVLDSQAALALTRFNPCTSRINPQGDRAKRLGQVSQTPVMLWGTGLAGLNSKSLLSPIHDLIYPFPPGLDSLRLCSLCVTQKKTYQIVI